MVELSAGDALVVPRGWWHYVQNLDPINIALNTWLPHVSIKYKKNPRYFLYFYLISRRPLVKIKPLSRSEVHLAYFHSNLCYYTHSIFYSPYWRVAINPILEPFLKSYKTIAKTHITID